MLLFSDLMEYEPDANMLFNYMMISALANVADRVEREGGKSSGGRIERLPTVNCTLTHLWHTLAVLCILIEG